MIGASAAQRKLLYALAAKCGEKHEHIKDRAAAIGLMSIADLTSEQAGFLIREYQDLITPPPPPQPTRANFGNLPKRVVKPAAQPSKPATPVSAAPIKPTQPRKIEPPVRRRNEMDDIPW